jgi:uncharacterized protein YkwD
VLHGGSVPAEPYQPPPVPDPFPLSLFETALSPPDPFSGSPATLRVRGSVAGGQFNGAWIAAPNGLGVIGMSACLQKPPPGGPLAPGAVNEVSLPFTFLAPGLQNLAVHTLSGSCAGTPRDVPRARQVNVKDPLAPQRTLARSSARAVASRCRGTGLSLTGRNAARWARALVCVQNEARAAQGLKPLKRSRTLARAAQAHAADMVRKQFFSHESPTRGSLDRRMERLRYAGESAENVAVGTLTPGSLVELFLASPGHRENLLLARQRFVGVGLVDANPVGIRRPGATVDVIFGTRR